MGARFAGVLTLCGCILGNAGSVSAQLPTYPAAKPGDAGYIAEDPQLARLVGRPGPALTLRLVDGGTIDLASSYGRKPVYLKLWATYCLPCRAQMPGFDKFSIKRVFASSLAADARRLPMTTNRNGSKRAIVPIGSYEQVMPLDILPTFLLRSLICGDTDQAQALTSSHLGPFSLAGRRFDTRTTTATLSVPGMQSVGWLCDPMPALPPRSSPG